MLREVGCGRSVGHDAKVSDSKGDGHGGCVGGVSLLFILFLRVLKMELEMRAPIARGGFVACGVILHVNVGCETNAGGFRAVF